MSTTSALQGFGASKPISGSSISAMVARVRQTWADRQTRIMLSDLDSRTLEDIGVDPSQARAAWTPMTDWVVQSHSGTARLVFIGR